MEQRCGVYLPKAGDEAAKVYCYNAGSTQLQGQPAPAATRTPEMSAAAIARNTVGAKRAASPMQSGLAAGIGAGLGGLIQDAQQVALLNNAQLLHYQPEQPQLRSAFGIR